MGQQDTPDQLSLNNNGHTALHSLNEIIQRLKSLHDDMLREKRKKARADIEKLHVTLTKLYKDKKKTSNVQRLQQISEEINEAKQDFKNMLEAKQQAAGLRIQNFYWENTGKMVPSTFVPIKEQKLSRTIHKLRHQGREILGINEVTEVMQQWYENTTNVPHHQSETLNSFVTDLGITLPQTTEQQNEMLQAEFSREEISYALSRAKEKSAPGPSGQNIAFFKLLFAFAPDLITAAVNQFAFVPGLADCKIFEWMRTRKIIYIPKKSQPESPGDYRPLSMLEIFYKIPSRIITARLTKVLPSLISDRQFGFMTNKGIQEPILLATHLLHDANQNNKPLQLVSFDIEKAFDKVSHQVIEQALFAFGIPTITVEAIKRLALVGYARVEVNGKKGILFQIKTGSGQGDPLLALLFLFASEPLNLALNKICQQFSIQHKMAQQWAPKPLLMME